MKHLVIDARAALPQLDGLGVYVRQIVPRIAAAGRFRVTLLANPAMLGFWKEAAPDAECLPSDCRVMWLRQNWEIPRVLSKLEPDLFFYPAHDPPYFLTVPFVFTIHDLNPFTVRPYFESHDTIKTAYLRFVVSAGVRGASRVLAVSNATRDTIGELFGSAARDKTVVTYNGIDQASHAESRRSDELLYVGTDRPHKNLPRLLEAYGRAVEQRPTIGKLNIVGALRSERQLRHQIARLRLEPRVVLHGHLSDAGLADLYNRCQALLMPSLAEGFGIPIVEAMSRGIPVVTSNTSACAEIADDAAMLVNPLDPADIARGLMAVTDDAELRASLAQRGRERAKAFSWDQSAARTLDVLLECAEESFRSSS